MDHYESTKDRYTEDKEYTKARQEKHKEIMDDFFNSNVNLLTPPEAILLGGGSGVGKSTMMDFLLKDFENRDIPIVVIDSDKIKEKIPEYEEKLKSDKKNAASYVHDESSDISADLISKCISEGKNFIYDGTMKNLEKYKGIIQNARDNNYAVVAMVVDTSIDIARDRVYVRFKKTGRNVKDEDIVASHKGVSQVYPILKDMVDEYFLVDTSSDEVPFKYVVTKFRGHEEEVHDEEKLQQFLEKWHN